MSEFEPSLRCFCFFSLFFFGVGEWVNGCLNNVLLFTAAAGLQMRGFGPSLPSFCVFLLCFPFFFGVGEWG